MEDLKKFAGDASAFFNRAVQACISISSIRVLFSGVDVIICVKLLINHHSSEFPAENS